MVLEEVYRQLQQRNLCNSAYEFSVLFLGKSKSYYSVLKARNEEPSIDAIATLEFALKAKAALYSERHSVFIRTKNDLETLGEQVKRCREKRVKDRLLICDSRHVN